MSSSALEQAGPPRPSNMHYVADTLAAGIAAFFVSPVVLAVDKALAENASGRQSLMPSFLGSMRQLVTQPHKYLRVPGFGWIFLVYSSSYLASNYCLTTCQQRSIDPKFPQWLATTVTNGGASIFKDRAFAKLFGQGPARPVPFISFGFWMLRDMISMLAFFTLPPIVGSIVSKHTGNERLGQYSAQFAVPLLAQFVLTPIHLIGYDKYNNPKHTSQEILKFLQTDYFKNVSLRMIRCIPPWTVGVIGNRELRKKIAQKLESSGY